MLQQITLDVAFHKCVRVSVESIPRCEIAGAKVIWTCACSSLTSLPSSHVQEYLFPHTLLNVVCYQSFAFVLRGPGKSKFLVVANLIGKKLYLLSCNFN